MYIDSMGIILNLNGGVCLDTGVKEDRKIAYQRAVEVLKNGYNLMIFPEGAWNLTDNFPVLGLYGGAIRMAIETGAEIVPIGVEQYDEDFYINIGKNFSCSKNVDKMREKLKTELSTLKWEIWESQGIHKNDFSQEFRDNFAQNIMDLCPYHYEMIDDYNTMYKTEAHEYIFKQLKLDKKMTKKSDA